MEAWQLWKYCRNDIFVMKSNSSIKTPISLTILRWMAYGVLFIVISGLVLSIYKTANAGLISFISSLLGSEEASAKIEDVQITSGGSQTIALLQPAVNYDPNPLKSSGTPPVNGDVLVPEIAIAEESYGSASVNTQISIYTVRPGDNLSTIGEMFGVSVNTIMWANDIKKASSIQPGQTLVILPVSGIHYTVKKGDTINGIVKKYKADLEEVLTFNGISIGTTLVVGETIIIPDAEIPVAIPTRTIASGSSSGSLPTYSGYYARPMRGGTKTQGIHGHNGIDIAAVSGTPVYAAAEGTVIISNTGGWNGGYGNYIVISHPNGTQTLYAHNARNLVRPGEYVDQGEQIATVGSTGKSTGPHLHFEVRGARNPF